MNKHILIIQGHPDKAEKHFGHALAEAYEKGARQAGYEVTTINVAELDLPVLHSKRDWDKGEPSPAVLQAQEAIRTAGHVVIFYPLWLGSMPALLKGFLEQILRPGFAVSFDAANGNWTRHLKGKSARVVITMGMPSFAYRFFYGAHSLKSLKRNILHFVGIKPVRSTIIGMVEGMNPADRTRWAHSLEALGSRAL